MKIIKQKKLITSGDRSLVFLLEDINFADSIGGRISSQEIKHVKGEIFYCSVGIKESIEKILGKF